MLPFNVVKPKDKVISDELGNSITILSMGNASYTEAMLARRVTKECIESDFILAELHQKFVVTLLRSRFKIDSETPDEKILQDEEGNSIPYSLILELYKFFSIECDMQPLFFMENGELNDTPQPQNESDLAAKPATVRYITDIANTLLNHLQNWLCKHHTMTQSDRIQ